MREGVDDQKTQPDSGDKDDDDDDEDSGPDNAVTRLGNGLEIWAQQTPEAANGSNDWVVSGTHTVTGKPLLSNDMHLGHQMPNLWYEAHLKSGALDVAGVTLPGMPYVLVGHNQSIAWGFTNVGPTVADVFIENFNSEGAYQTPQGWQQPEHRPGSDPRQRETGCDGRCKDHASWADNFRNNSRRIAAGRFALDPLRWAAHAVF